MIYNIKRKRRGDEREEEGGREKKEKKTKVNVAYRVPFFLRSSISKSHLLVAKAYQSLDMP